jgi:excisionase family DNA binding protein
LPKPKLNEANFKVLLLAELRLIRKGIAQPRPSVPRLLSIKDAAHYLGATTWAMRTLQWERTIPHIKIGQRVLFDIADLNAFVERQKEVCAGK